MQVVWGQAHTPRCPREISFHAVVTFVEFAYDHYVLFKDGHVPQTQARCEIRLLTGRKS